MGENFHERLEEAPRVKFHSMIVITDDVMGTLNLGNVQ